MPPAKPISPSLKWRTVRPAVPTAHQIKEVTQRRFEERVRPIAMAAITINPPGTGCGPVLGYPPRDQRLMVVESVNIEWRVKRYPPPPMAAKTQFSPFLWLSMV